MVTEQPPRPANMGNIVAINQGKRPLTMEVPDVPRLTPGEARQRIESATSTK